MLGAEVGEDGENARRVVKGGVYGDDEVGKQEEEESQSSRCERPTRPGDCWQEEGYKWRRSQDMQRGEQWVDKAHFLVRDQGERERHDQADQPQLGLH